MLRLLEEYKTFLKYKTSILAFYGFCNINNIFKRKLKNHFVDVFALLALFLFCYQVCFHTMFYEQHFRTKVFQAAFLCLRLRWCTNVHHCLSHLVLFAQLKAWFYMPKWSGCWRTQSKLFFQKQNLKLLFRFYVESLTRTIPSFVIIKKLGKCPNGEIKTSKKSSIFKNINFWKHIFFQKETWQGKGDKGNQYFLTKALLMVVRGKRCNSGARST